MNTTKRRVLRAALIFSTIALVGTYVIGASAQPAHDHQANQASAQKPAAASLETIHAKQVPAIQDAVRKAIQHIEAGHTQMALTELKRAQTSLESVQKALGEHIGPQFANDRCPMMGSPIKAENVKPDLVRTYKGQKVAFCCAGCPAAWDRLSDAQKAAKLQAVSDKGHSRN